MARIGTNTSPLPLHDRSFEAVNSIYAHAAKSKHVNRRLLMAWYRGAMVWETGDADVMRERFHADEDVRRSFCAGERGRVPAFIINAARIQRAAA